MRSKENIHIVIDIETLGTIESLLELGGCPILEAAFVVVQYNHGQFENTNQFTTPFSLKNQDDRTIDPETVAWHQAKNPNYATQLNASNTIEEIAHLRFYANLSAICDMAENDGTPVHFWSKGKDFDFTILKDFALKHGLRYPFMSNYGYVKTHCLRDLIYFSGFNERLIQNTNPHSAVSDAITEAKILTAILNQE